MVCHTCGKGVEPGQQFCSGCGASLRGVTDATQVVEAQSVADAHSWRRPSPPSSGRPTIRNGRRPERCRGRRRPAAPDALPLDDVPEITQPEVVVNDDDVWALTSENYAATAPRPQHHRRDACGRGRPTCRRRDASFRFGVRSGLFDPDRHHRTARIVRHADRRRERRPARCSTIAPQPASEPARGCSTTSPATSRSRC